mmetsp:Transcript_69408/g.192035  ORF Transcript_69408/g.192035 Transcript_69408/m.192035 type:complete len:199 (-) Transcript_69408:74-670(-)
MAAAAAKLVKRPLEDVPVDSPLRFRRTGYIYALSPADEPTPPPLALSVDAVLREAAERRASAATATAVPHMATGVGAPDDAAASAAADTEVGNADSTWPRLIGTLSSEVIHLACGSSTTLGRHASCGVVVNESCVSGRHCILHCSDDGHVQVEDLSSNSTYVNGSPVAKGRRVSLRHKDRLALTRRSSGWLYIKSPGQ